MQVEKHSQLVLSKLETEYNNSLRILRTEERKMECLQEGGSIN